LRSDNELDEGTITLAKLMFAALIKTGIDNDLAIKQIFHIQPFNDYPQLIEYLK